LDVRKRVLIRMPGVGKREVAAPIVSCKPVWRDRKKPAAT